MSTRDRIAAAVKCVLKEIAETGDDEDVCELARVDCNKLYAGINAALLKFNRFEGWQTDGGPTPDDLKGTVTHGS